MSLSGVVTVSLDPTDAPSCGSCGSTGIVRSESEVFCSACGVVADSMPIVVNAYPRESGVRPGGQSLAGVPGRIAYNLRWAEKVSRHGQAGRGEFYEAPTMLRVAVDRLGLPSPALQRAIHLYRTLAASIGKHRVSHRLLIGAVVVMACRGVGIAKSLREVAEVIEVTQFQLGSALRKLGKYVPDPPPLLGPDAYLRRFLTQVGWSFEQREAALLVLSRYMAECPCPRHSPIALAAGVLRHVSMTKGPPMRLTQLAKVTGLTEVTIRNVVHGIVSALN